jgi:hypothetical protein
MKKTIIVFILLSILYFVNIFFSCETTQKRFSIIGNKEIEFISKIKNCGATTGYLYELYIVKRGDKLSFFDSPIYKANDYNPNIVCNDNHIIIDTNSTRVFYFSNFKYIDNKEYIFKLLSP